MAAEKKQAKKAKGKGRRVAGLVILALLVVGAIVGYTYYNTYFSKNIKNVDDKSYLFIRTGATYADVLTQLREKDFLISIDHFDKVARQRGYDAAVKPGKYKVEKGMSNLELVNMLIGGRQVPVKFTFNNIRLKQELAAKVGRNLEADSLQMESLLGDDAFWQQKGFTAENCMVMFLPDTYEFWWNTDAPEFIDKMAKEYKKFWTDERKAKAKKIGLTQAEVSILAAIVEKESNKSDERPTIAGVYMNRLNTKMKLQADPTVVYALGDFTIKRVLTADTRIDSPYNTYKYAGLPPGPICLPSKNSIDAVLNYKSHKYLYFCAKEDFSGYHSFAVTYDEHLKNSAKFQKAMNERGITR